MNEIQSGANREEVLKRAMDNPDVQKIMNDPVMQTILKQMQTEPGAYKEYIHYINASHMKNPAIAAKIRTLMNHGVVNIG